MGKMVIRPPVKSKLCYGWLRRQDDRHLRIWRKSVHNQPDNCRISISECYVRKFGRTTEMRSSFETRVEKMRWSIVCLTKDRLTR